MDGTHTDDANQPRPLRLWPGVLLVALMGFMRFVLPTFVPDALMFGVLAVPLAGLLFVIWWGFFSRAPGFDRWFGVLVVLAVLAGASPLLHESMAKSMMGLLFPLYALPLVCTALLVWAVLSRSWPQKKRAVTLVVAVLLASSPWFFLRTGGFTIEVDSDFAWRWSPTPEERLLAEETALPKAAAAAEDELDDTGSSDASNVVPAWPGFRGASRDGVVRGVQIATDWDASPPQELWRRPIGPGWSSFAVAGDRIYTQEQRGEEEAVACYDLNTGAPIWRHTDQARFWEAIGGAGPRATPTLHEGRVYALGATGVLNALDAADGSVLWSRNAAEDTEVETPMWGFCGSPVLVDGVVIVATEGVLVAYDAATGESRWTGPRGGDGYSSPHLLNLHGVPQVVLLSKTGAVSLRPASGELIWEYPWEGRTRIIQPALVGDSDLLISKGEVTGLRRVHVAHADGQWSFDERWDTARLKPYFSDMVVHDGHAFGVDGSVLACVDIETGKRVWKGGRYGSGQLFLLADQGLLLVLSEAGELALVAAKSDDFEELALFQALDGKTWNHPVLVDDVLLLRNAEEMAAFRLTLASN